MFLLLYIMGLLFGASITTEQCGQGYLSDDGCSVQVLSDHIFSATDQSLSDDYTWDNNDVGPFGVSHCFALLVDRGVFFLPCLR
jgi:hypothetical protein